MQEHLKSIVDLLKELSSHEPMQVQELISGIIEKLHRLKYSPKQLEWDDINDNVIKSLPIIKNIYYKISENSSGEYSTFLLCGSGQEFIALTRSLEHAKKLCQEHFESLYSAMSNCNLSLVSEDIPLLS